MERKLITKKALIFIIFLLLTATILYFLLPKSQGDIAEIWVDGKLYKSFDLNDSFEVTLKNGIIIKGDGKSAHFVESSCRDKICINTGSLSLSGQWAACLPNSTVLKIKGEEANADTVS